MLDETACDGLREGLDLIWKGLAKEKEEYSDNQTARVYLEEAESKLNFAENLFLAGQIQEAAEVVLQAGNLLNTLDFRCGLAHFREANRLQQNRNPEDARVKEFAKRAAHLLDQAEANLDEGRIEEARSLLLNYHQEKVTFGLTGPPFKW